MKHVYGNDPEFVSLTEKLGKIRLQYHLTDKAWLLPPNMRAMARFMNLREWVTWGQKMLGCLDSLDDDTKEAYSFLLQYRDLIEELGVCVESVTYLETLCKCEGFGLRTNALCQYYIIRNLIGNASNRRACVGLRMLDYFKAHGFHNLRFMPELQDIIKKADTFASFLTDMNPELKNLLLRNETFNASLHKKYLKYIEQRLKPRKK